LTVFATVGGAFIWKRWDRRRDVSRQHVGRQSAHGWRLAELYAVLLVLLVARLMLDSFGVPGAGIAALIAVVALTVLVYLDPFLGPRRRQRQ
jgi:Flp pilus assembly protein TadB